MALSSDVLSSLSRTKMIALQPARLRRYSNLVFSELSFHQNLLSLRNGLGYSWMCATPRAFWPNTLQDWNFRFVEVIQVLPTSQLQKQPQKHHETFGCPRHNYNAVGAHDKYRARYKTCSRCKWYAQSSLYLQVRHHDFFDCVCAKIPLFFSPHGSSFLTSRDGYRSGEGG